MKLSAPALAAAVVLLASPIHARQPNSSQPVDKPFAKGGSIQMKLAAGDYRISGRPDDRIRLSWRADRPEQAANLRAAADVSGTRAVITTAGFKNGVHFTIEVPTRSDIDVDLSAGDLEVRGVEGNKKVESWAGDVSIDIGQPEQYRRVEASVRAGDLTARPFNVSKGGLMRSFTWDGKGPYSLMVKLFAGDLTLR
jgi:hypothetical protein